MPSAVIDDRAVAGAATHAIVIGVGRYPHLPGGGAPTVAQPEGMAQLTSPPISARKVAEWLIQNLNVPDKPLASVALLLSEARPAPFRNPRTGVSTAVEVATIENLKTALEDWRARGDALPDQRLLFYFCGHGIGKGSDTALLAADYGASPRDPLDAAIDFRNFLLGMSLATAAEQVYVVDACRVHSGSLLNAGGYSGRPIFRPDLAAPPNPNLKAPVFYAALAGTAVFARERKASIFTEALLHGLNGAGANDDEGQGEWWVTALGLKAALDFDLDRALKRLGRAQIPAADNAAPMGLQFLKATPSGTAILICDPPEATRAARFSYSVGGTVTRRPDNRLGAWTLELPADTYEFRADFPRGRWQAQPQTAWIRPVFKKVKLKAV